MAGMPDPVLIAAEHKLQSLERKAKAAGKAADGASAAGPMQLSFFQMDDPLLLDIKHIIENIDINSISPLNAFDTIRQIKNKLNGGKEDGIDSSAKK
jgi:DNA mismatch repair protein MutS